MITNMTPAAAPTNVINSEQKQLVFFGVGSASQTSQTFTVDQQPFYLSAYNLGSTDVITVQQVFGQGSGTEVASFAPVNGTVTLNQNRTKVRIDHPGRYQLLHTGSSALGTFTVAGGAAVMTSDPLGDLAEALYQIFTTLGGNITVAAPITLTGAGTTASPYVIGFQANTVIGSSNITVTGAGTTASPYVVSVNASAPAGSAPPNFVEVEGISPITVSGNGTSATPYLVGFSGGGGGLVTGTEPIEVTGSGPYAISTPDIGVNHSSPFNINIGAGSDASGSTNGIAIGGSSTASASGGIAIGESSNVTSIGVNPIAIGVDASCAGAESIAIGSSASAPQPESIAIGNNAGSGETHSDTIIIASKGSATNATQDHQIVLGTSTQTQLVTAGSIIQAGAISASDERLKENIEAEFNALEALDKLSPVTFMWDREAVITAKVPMNEDEYGKLQHGFIAQEVEDYFPELIEVIDRGAGPYKFVRYDRLISVLVAAVQELSLEVKFLKEKQ